MVLNVIACMQGASNPQVSVSAKDSSNGFIKLNQGQSLSESILPFNNRNDPNNISRYYSSLSL